MMARERTDCSAPGFFVRQTTASCSTPPEAGSRAGRFPSRRPPAGDELPVIDAKPADAPCGSSAVQEAAVQLKAVDAVITRGLPLWDAQSPQIDLTKMARIGGLSEQLHASRSAP
jgi:hypothetical protein